MNAETLISSPLSEPWMAWVMLALLLCLVLIHVGDQQTIPQAFTNMFSRLTRTYGDLRIRVATSVLTSIFRIGVAAITTTLFLYRGGGYSINSFLYWLAFWTGFDIVKILLIALINYVFQFARQFAEIYIIYANVWLVISVVLFAIALLVCNIPAQIWTQPLIIVLLSLAAISSLIRWERIFCHSFVSLLNIMLIFVTIEFVPLLGLASVMMHFVVK